MIKRICNRVLKEREECQSFMLMVLALFIIFAGMLTLILMQLAINYMRFSQTHNMVTGCLIGKECDFAECSFTDKKCVIGIDFIPDSPHKTEDYVTCNYKNIISLNCFALSFMNSLVVLAPLIMGCFLIYYLFQLCRDVCIATQDEIMLVEVKSS